MRDVAIIGLGITPVGEHWDSSLRMLAATAGQSALKDAGLKTVDALYIGNAYGSSFSSQSQLGSLIADYMGLVGTEAYCIEAGDASGAAALRTGYLAVASGAVNSTLVIGVEKSTDSIGSSRISARNVSLDADYESAHGATLSALAALLMRRYMHEYNLELNAFEGFSINAHANGKRNPNAMYRNTIKLGAFANAPMVAEPVNLFDSAPDGDGAAAVLIVPTAAAGDMVPNPVRITGSAVATDTLMLQDRIDKLFLNAVHLATTKALSQANVSLNDINLYELHDAYTIVSTLSLEAIGLASRGKGWEFGQNGGAIIALNGQVPMCTFGGLKSRGNPAGATGVYQAVEACLQLRGQAGDNQVTHARTALIQNLGGLASTAITHILQV